MRMGAPRQALVTAPDAQIRGPRIKAKPSRSFLEKTQLLHPHSLLRSEPDPHSGCRPYPRYPIIQRRGSGLAAGAPQDFQFFA